jgi:hypothetical protein
LAFLSSLLRLGRDHTETERKYRRVALVWIAIAIVVAIAVAVFCVIAAAPHALVTSLGLCG